MQSPFADKLFTNYVPLGPEIEQIQQIIAGPVERISHLDEKIARLQAIIDDLSRDKDNLSKFVRDHRALLSGARRLPQDLVQEIFFRCIPANRNAVMCSTESPLLLGRICSSWRQIALITPQLWSSLHVAIPDSSFLHKHGRSILIRRAEAVKAWLDLSGCCSLSLSLVADYHIYARDTQESSFATSYLLQVMIQFSRRWNKVDLTLPVSMFSHYFATLAEQDFPVLEKIRWRPLEELPELYSHIITVPILQTPSLRHAYLRFADYSRLVLPWE
jgi:hypothetical protein